MTSNTTLSLSKITMHFERTTLDSVFYTIVVLLGTTGNSMVIWVAGFRMKPTVTNVWLVNLAVADLIFCLTQVMSVIKSIFYDYWPFGLFLCKFNGFFKYANMFCSVFLLAVISVDRVLCICHPVFTRKRRTLCAARVVSVGVWIVAVMFSSPYFVYRQIYLGKNNLSRCSFKEKEIEGGISSKMTSNTTLLLHTHSVVSNHHANTTVETKAIRNNLSIVFITIIILLGTAGNSVVIWVAGFRLKPTVTNVWLVNLAVADMIFCLTRITSLIKAIFYDNWIFGLFLCKFNGFIKYANMFCSVFLLAVISLDRALCVWCPVLTRERRTICAARVVSVGVWIVAVIFSSPYFVYRQVYLGDNRLIQCSFKDCCRKNSKNRMNFSTTFLHHSHSEVLNHHANSKVDTEDIVNKVNIVFLSFTVFFGTTGNSMVIWVAGFHMNPTVTNVCVDRALCVCHPVLTRERRTLCAARVVSVGVWIVAVIFSSPYFVYRQVFNKNNMSQCTLKENGAAGDSSAKYVYYCIRFVCGFLLPFLVILICYILAAVRIRRTRLSGKSRPLRILAVLVCAFFLCWAPYHFLGLVKLVNEDNKAIKDGWAVASNLAYFNSCVNPVLYFCMGLDVNQRCNQSLYVIFRRAFMEERQSLSQQGTREESCNSIPKTEDPECETKV
ncbi:hypothetical protein Q8A67_015716 [Cirrhinus molitorella]|uniref:G-protein coupled receptors family 1 profile domain-containing protein n=1 Tax=Cirrhinus molitorella TaxID=172907 RepID=A0AA88PMA2_9TELE|nr:hypothetical protein Q8A67_015716 [Cirrhinus molitorella]